MAANYKATFSRGSRSTAYGRCPSSFIVATGQEAAPFWRRKSPHLCLGSLALHLPFHVGGALHSCEGLSGAPDGYP